MRITWWAGEALLFLGDRLASRRLSPIYHLQRAIVTTSTPHFLPFSPGSCPISEEIILYK